MFIVWVNLKQFPAELAAAFLRLALLGQICTHVCGIFCFALVDLGDRRRLDLLEDFLRRTSLCPTDSPAASTRQNAVIERTKAKRVNMSDLP